VTWIGWAAPLAAAFAAVCAAAVGGYLLGRRALPAIVRPAADVAAGSAAQPEPETLLDGVIAAHDLSAGADAVRVRLEQALGAAGVHRMVIEDGAVFDPGRHHAVGTAAAADDGTDRRVAREVRPGWQRGEHVVRPAEVIVWTR
jgi:hypothetical protein